MKFHSKSLLAAATALALLTGAPAMAQMHGKGDGPRHEQMVKRMAERQSQLKAALKLTPAQEAAWTRYTNAHQPPKQATPPDRDAWAKLTTPQRLDQMQAKKAERNAHMAQVMDATRALYAALDAEQQKVFDSQAPMAGMGMGGKHRGERGMQGQHRHEQGGMRHGG
ncbi:MAG: Spy/CpxP family protein refolding chaperone [Hydrogenophaga sp.]|nr:Spy/CpxP family protein refolding chaperone [Hydrogenophaga sp.]